jgi:hypothetical protein
MKKYILSTCCALVALSFCSCGFSLIGGSNGQVATPALSATTSSNIVIAAEKTLQVSKDSIDLFLHLEYDNHDVVLKSMPQVHTVAEFLRREAPAALVKANNAKNAFKHNRNAENQASLMTAVATVSSLAAQAQQATIKLNQP